MQGEFNQRINDEMYSWYLYLSMAAHFEGQNLRGFAQWMRLQAQEEMAHAMKNYAYLLDRGGRVALKPIDAVPGEWDSPLAAFEAAYAHEQKITAIYDAFMDTAAREKDKAAQIFLQWFVSEQVEEEASASEWVEKLRRAQDAPGAMFMLDREAGTRPAA